MDATLGQFNSKYIRKILVFDEEDLDCYFPVTDDIVRESYQADAEITQTPRRRGELMSPYAIDEQGYMELVATAAGIPVERLNARCIIDMDTVDYFRMIW